MQCINFKSRLEREREMIRRKIRSSTLYRKPSFSKSAFNIYNPNNDVTKVSVISKNLKINEFRDDTLRKSKSPLLVNDEQEDECSNEEKSMLCIGNKYLDLTSNLITNSIAKSMSTSTLNLMNDEKFENDFERAISQSHLSPATAVTMSVISNSLMKKSAASNGDVQENLKKPKTAAHSNNKSLSSPFLSQKSDTEKTSDGDDAQDALQSPSEKRKTHKIIKKSALLYNSHHHHLGAGCGKYSDALKTEVALDDLPNSLVADKTLNNNNSNLNTSSSSTSNSNNAVKTVKKSSATVSRKIKSSKKYSEAHREPSIKSTTTRKSESS